MYSATSTRENLVRGGLRFRKKIKNKHATERQRGTGEERKQESSKGRWNETMNKKVGKKNQKKE
jgi:hypothetical protein